MKIAPKVLTFHYSAKNESLEPDPISDSDSDVSVSNIGSDGQLSFYAVLDGVNLFKPTESGKQALKSSVSDAVQSLMVNFLGEEPSLSKAWQNLDSFFAQENKTRGVTPENVDHVKHQFFSAVGCFGYIHKNTFHFSQLNDCGVMVFDPSRNREVDVVLNQTATIKFIENNRQQNKWEPDSEAEHVFVRSSVVNNSTLNWNDVPLNFGVCDGTGRCFDFIKYGSYSLWPNQVIFLYSDGFLPFVYDKEFVDLAFTSNSENISRFVLEKEKLDPKFRKEKTLHIIRT